jgi:hypothetical protein
MTNPSEGCCGVLTTCCGPEVNMVLNVTLTNACGTFTATIGWDSNARGGLGAWTGAMQIKCKPNLVAPCNTTFTVLNLVMHCSPSGFVLDTGLGVGNGTNTVCPPPNFSVTFTISVSGCAPQQVFVVTWP